MIVTSFPLRVRRTVAAMLALAIGVGGGVLVSAPAHAAPPPTLNPFAMNGGFTVYAREDLVLGNDETEGSLAAGGVASSIKDGQYTIIHVAAGTADYTLPAVDGDPTRLLVGAYDVASRGILAITSAGTDDPALHGDLKMVERGGPWQASARADWLRLNLDPADVDRTPLIDATAQIYPDDAVAPAGAVGAGSIYTVDTSTDAVAGYVEANAAASYDDAASCLDDLASGTTGTAVSVGYNDGSRAVLEGLSADEPNVVDYADLAGVALIQFAEGGPTPGADNPLVIRVAAGTTAVAGARSDPQGAYSPYIFWDLSALSGPVEVTAAQGRIDGSIYAPDADLTVTAAPLDGQVLGQNVTLEGGEVHSFLFAGTLACQPAEEGTFAVQKTLSGIDSDDLPPDATFTVNYTATAPDGAVTRGSLDLPADGSPVAAGLDLPFGTVVEFEEIAPPTVPGYTWSDVAMVPSTVTIDADSPSPVVTVDNTATADPTGTFAVAKTVSGLPPGATPTGSVAVGWTAFFEGARLGSGSLVVPLDGTEVASGVQLPVGTRVLLVEDRATLPEIPGYDWSGAAWSPSRLVEITTAGATVAVTVDNAYVPEASARVVSVVKVIDDASQTAFDYTLSYATDPDGPESTIPLPLDEPASITGLDPAATTIYLAEEAPTLGGVTLDVTAWDDPVYRIVTDAGVQEVSAPFGTVVPVSIPADGPVAIEVSNSLREGTFTLSKQYTGIPSEVVPASRGFTVAWSALVPGGDVWDGVMRVPADGSPASPTDADGVALQFPFGTEVTFAEQTPPALPGITWGTPVITPEQVTIGAGGESTVAVVVTNSATLATGTFTVSKDLVGIAPDRLAVDALAIDYQYWFPGQGVRRGTFALPTDGTAAGPVDDAGDPVEFPVGTIVHLSEPAPSPDVLPPGAEWAGTTWSPSSFLVIRADAVVERTVANSVELNTRYSVVKTVTGPAASAVPSEATFAADWWVDGEQQPRLTLVPGVALTSTWFPVGSIVEASEPMAPDVAGVQWADPAWTVDGTVLAPGEDGRIVIPNDAVADTSTVQIALENVADRAPDPDPTPAPGVLPATGAPSSAVAVWGATGALAVGLLLVLRRRSHSSR